MTKQIILGFMFIAIAQPFSLSSMEQDGSGSNSPHGKNSGTNFLDSGSQGSGTSSASGSRRFSASPHSRSEEIECLICQNADTSQPQAVGESSSSSTSAPAHNQRLRIRCGHHFHPNCLQSALSEGLTFGCPECGEFIHPTTILKHGILPAATVGQILLTMGNDPAERFFGTALCSELCRNQDVGAEARLHFSTEIRPRLRPHLQPDSAADLATELALLAQYANHCIKNEHPADMALILAEGDIADLLEQAKNPVYAENSLDILCCFTSNPAYNFEQNNQIIEAALNIALDLRPFGRLISALRLLEMAANRSDAAALQIATVAPHLKALLLRGEDIPAQAALSLVNIFTAFIERGAPHTLTLQDAQHAVQLLRELQKITESCRFLAMCLDYKLDGYEPNPTELLHQLEAAISAASLRSDTNGRLACFDLLFSICRRFQAALPGDLTMAQVLATITKGCNAPAPSHSQEFTTAFQILEILIGRLTEKGTPFVLPGDIVDTLIKFAFSEAPLAPFAIHVLLGLRQHQESFVLPVGLPARIIAVLDTYEDPDDTEVSNFLILANKLFALVAPEIAPELPPLITRAREAAEEEVKETGDEIPSDRNEAIVTEARALLATLTRLAGEELPS